jgi:hypothetical protein
MDIQELLKRLKVDNIEVVIGRDNDNYVNKIRDAKFRIIKEEKGEPYIALVLMPDRKSSAMYIPDEVQARLWEGR